MRSAIMMSFFNLIKFRKLFLLLISFYIVYLIQKFVFFPASLKSTPKGPKLPVKESVSHQIKSSAEKITLKEPFKVSNYLENCGSEHSCNENEFVIHLYTGFQNSINPKLCIDGKYLSDQIFGRGINLVAIDNITRKVTSVQNFDTNLKDSTIFETRLLSLRPGDKIILFTYDEVPTKLSKVAKLLINELGSMHIQNLQFRTSWYLISEKQIEGYSPFEEIHLPVHGMQWPLGHDVYTCVPFQIKGDFVKIDQSLFGNKARVEYCKQFKNKWRGFCDDDVVNEPLSLYTISPSNNLLHNTPILIFTDPDRNDLLSTTLETLFRQPGVFLPKNVLIFYYQTDNELHNLVDLFLFQSFRVDLGSKDFFAQIHDKLKKEFDSVKQFILIFGNLVLTADFLNYFHQLIPLLWQPNSELSFVSAWNDRCKGRMCSDEKLVFRVNGNRFCFKHALAIKHDHRFFPLLEKIIYLNSLKNLSIVIDDAGDGLVPDFPRILVSNEVSDLFSDGRSDAKVSLFENVKLNQIESLCSVKSYAKSLNEFKENSLKLNDEESLIRYLDSGRENNTSANITILSNSTTFDKICTIFNLKYCSPTIYINGLGDTLRFNFDTNLSVLIIRQALNK